MPKLLPKIARLKSRLATLFILLMILLVSSFWPSPAAWAADLANNLANGAQIFEVHCAGCHGNGGNIVRRGKTLKLKALQRNGVDSIEAIAQLVAQGKGNMSAYEDRLTPAEIQAVSAYVLQQAEANWRQ